VKFHDMKYGRLKNVYLKYRELGSKFWQHALTKNKHDQLKKVDFADNSTTEADFYGYHTSQWSLDMVKEGSYEIKVGSECNDLGGPGNIDNFDAPIIRGVFDTEPPEQYGDVLPLRTDIKPGEEITVVFTEKLLCEKPHSFKIKVLVGGHTFENNHVFVVCEERRISFQLDYSYVNLTKHVGKDLEVKIGNFDNSDGTETSIKDINGNRMVKPNGFVQFTKKIARIELGKASTSFLYTFKHNPEDFERVEDEAMSKIVSQMGLFDTSRIEMCDFSFSEASGLVSVKVTLNPASSSDRGRLLRVDVSQRENEPHSVNLFYQLQKKSQEVKVHRLLLDTNNEQDYLKNSYFSVSEMKILPGVDDMHLFELDPSVAEVEKHLYSVAMSVEEEYVLDDQQKEIFQVVRKHEEVLLAEAQKREELLLAEEHVLSQKREEMLLAEVQKREEMLLAKMQNREETIGGMRTELQLITLVCFGFACVLLFFLQKK